MSRLADDIAVLERMHGICWKAVEAPHGILVPVATFYAIAEEARALILAPREYRLFHFDTLVMIEAAKLLTLARADNDDVMATRWLDYAGLALANIALDLDNARKSARELA